MNWGKHTLTYEKVRSGALKTMRKSRSVNKDHNKQIGLCQCLLQTCGIQKYNSSGTDCGMRTCQSSLFQCTRTIGDGGKTSNTKHHNSAYDRNRNNKCRGTQ